MNVSKRLRSIGNHLWLVGKGNYEIVVLRIGVVEELRSRIAHGVDLVRHAAAEVDEDPHQKRRIFCPEVLDLLFTAALVKLEVVPREIDHRMILDVSHSYRNQHHLHIHTQMPLRFLQRTMFSTRLFTRSDVDIVASLRDSRQPDEKSSHADNTSAKRTP